MQLLEFTWNHSLYLVFPELLAQSNVRVRTAPSSSTNPGAVLLQLVIQLAIYAVIAYCTQVFLKKLEYEKSWFAWIPVMNTYAVLEAGEQENPILWAVLTLVPCIGLVSLIKIIPAYITICNRLGKSPAILWTFLLCGLGALIVPAVLAFT